VLHRVLIAWLLGLSALGCSAAPSSGGARTESEGADGGSSGEDAAAPADALAPTDAATQSEGSFSDGESSDGGESGDAGSNMGWGSQTAVEDIFVKYCSGCHGAQWSTCWNVQDNATGIASLVSSGAMPRGSTLPPSVKTTLLDWLEEGAPCASPPPDGGFDAGMTMKAPTAP
jgi:hypothetical protein